MGIGGGGVTYIRCRMLDGNGWRLGVSSWFIGEEIRTKRGRGKGQVNKARNENNIPYWFFKLSTSAQK